MANHSDFVDEFLDRADIDGHVETGQDVLVMATNHPGKLGQEFRTPGKWFLKVGCVFLLGNMVHCGKMD